jgi:hypothetical protein
MTKYCKQNLQEIKSLIVSIKNDHYLVKSKLLSGSTIGQHVRHILEFYICLMHGARKGTVNYDQRERDLELETNRQFAGYTIDKICSNLSVITNCEILDLECNFSSKEGSNTIIKTSFSRELAYCLEHSIHHQALIKIGLIEQHAGHLIDPKFGVGHPTIRHIEKCAQ